MGSHTVWNLGITCYVILVILPLFPITAAAQENNKIGAPLALFANLTIDDTSLHSGVQYNRVGDTQMSRIIKELREKEVDHVRLVVNPLPLMKKERQKASVELNVIKEFVVRANRENIAVFIDLHTWPPRDPEQQTFEIISNSELRSAYKRAVYMVAQIITSTKNSKNRLELMNEPSCKALGWADFQLQLYDLVRSRFKRVNLVITGCGGSIETLLALNTAHYRGDSHVYYTFHFYEPFIFTHQQTYYGLRLRGVPFPPSPIKATIDDDVERYLPVMATPDMSRRRQDLRHYLRQHAYPAYLSQRIRSVSVWAKQRGIANQKIYVGEYGMNITTFDKDFDLIRPDMVRWFSLTTRLIKRQGFSATTWPPINGGLVSLGAPRAKTIYDSQEIKSVLGWK